MGNDLVPLYYIYHGMLHPYLEQDQYQKGDRKIKTRHWGIPKFIFFQLNRKKKLDGKGSSSGSSSSSGSGNGARQDTTLHIARLTKQLQRVSAGRFVEVAVDRHPHFRFFRI